MAADALAHCAARPSATPILTEQDNWDADTEGDDSDSLQLIYYGIFLLGLQVQRHIKCTLSDVLCILDTRRVELECVTSR